MRHVFFFGDGHADGTAEMKEVLGGKGANLAEMTNLGVPVPPGFTLSARLCPVYLREGSLRPEVRHAVEDAMARLERATGRGFGNTENPLLVSVRSGAKVSMPGMMDTILNLGLNDATVAGLGRHAGNERFAYDSYRRFVQMYGNVVYGLKPEPGEPDPFEAAIRQAMDAGDVQREIDLAPDHLRQLVQAFKTIIQQHGGRTFPDDPWHQLWGAIEAVFRSWNTPRAVHYRRIHRISDELGTAVNVMAMVYGNTGEDSGTGVVFTRSPSTGASELFGEYLSNAQGEDVVAGIRDPEPIATMATRLPGAFRELREMCRTLERHYRDVQDVEFTVEHGRLHILQTRTAKRTTHAAVRVAVDMVGEGLISEREAVGRVRPEQLDQLLHPTIDPNAMVDVLATGLPASPGAAVGRAVFDANTAVARAHEHEPVILVRHETNPDDFHGMAAARAILTARGGMTSHAAVVARGMGKSCVAGCKDLDVSEEKKQFVVDGRVVREGDWITVDGSTGRVISGKVPLVEPGFGEDFTELMTWADNYRMLRVRANADTPADASRARSFGAEGIGLCRTEHMFFEGDRIHAMREMIVAGDAEGRRQALAKLLPMQRDDFRGIFKAMDGLPVTIRLLDPPLHEFLPRGEAEARELATRLGISEDHLHQTIDALTEVNPMLGHRGCRLGVTFPEITEMQAHAIFEAACDAAEDGVDVRPEVMIPLVADVEELKRQAAVVRRAAAGVFERRHGDVEYSIGTMIELPRAALTADRVAEEADFFSFGTNDLTQTTFGMSRDDAGRYLPLYVEAGILPDDPFQTLDHQGVGRLVELAVELGRKTNPRLKIGICGEHGGDPRSIALCHRLGLHYVSCSPFRVPIARLAAAQVALQPEEAEASALA